MVLAFAGRRPGPDFPAGAVAAVRERIEARLDELRPRVVVGSAAAGADLLVAEAALRAGAAAELLLAGERERFRAESVADRGEEWGAAFDALLDRDGVLVRELPRRDGGEESYRAVTAAIVRRAEELAVDEEPVALLAVLPARPGASHTTEIVTAAASRGWRVVRVDPLDL
ncbi:MAG: hypothetical protein ACOYD4_04480 [Solirubrobacterales bacterium]